MTASPGMAISPDDIGEYAISVIVPTFNRAHLVERAIHSILNQTYRPAEIIVIDDGSSDNTESVIAAYSGEIPLTYIRLEQNGGGAVARNAGIIRGKGEYVAFLDSDDEWHHDHLRVVMRAAVRRSGYFAVASSALRIGKKPRVLPGREYPQRQSVAEKLHFVLSAALAFQTSTLLMTQETARRFMFDPHLRRHQDWDLVFRMIESDVAMVLLPDATVRYHPTHAGNVGVSRSEFPSLRFLVKHKNEMSSKTRARFITLQIIRRRRMGVRVVGSLVYTLALGGISPKEFIYYLRESVLANNFDHAVSARQN